MNEIVQLLGCYGLAFGLVNDKVPGVSFARRIPIMDRALDCMYCTGFHCGWVVQTVHLSTSPAPPIGMWVVSTLSWAFASAASCYAIDAVIRWFENPVPSDG